MSKDDLILAGICLWTAIVIISLFI